jgi:ankyrin repeat protein
LGHADAPLFLQISAARSRSHRGLSQGASALLDAGANPNTGFFEENHQPKPEWECALYGAAGVAHHPELTKLLLDRGADPNDGEVAYHSPETLDNRTIHVLIESGKLTQDSIGLMLARKFNWHDDDGVHWLLEHGADPNWPLWGSRPMHWALRHGTPIHYFHWLLDHGADPSLPDKNGTGPVAEAVRQGRADVLELFEKRGVIIALEGDDAFTTLHKNGLLAKLQAVIDLGATMRDSSGAVTVVRFATRIRPRRLFSEEGVRGSRKEVLISRQ